MSAATPRPRLVHVTTVDMSLALLLLPQLVAFREAGYEVIGVSAPGPHVCELDQAGIRHVALRGSTRGADLKADLTAARHFVALCRALRPTIVHTHNPKPGVYGRIGARWAGVPIVVNTVHGLYAQPTDPVRRRIAVYALERFAAAHSDAELLQNPEDRSVLRRLGVPEGKLVLLGNGVDLARFDPSTSPDRQQARSRLGVHEDEFVIGLVGRLVAEKGYREVFEAVRLVRFEEPRVRFVVVGPHDEDKGDAISRDELRMAEGELGIRFLGMRGDVERLYPGMDLYVLASHREGFPRSAMEAAAMGLPIVATNIRGCRQVVQDGVNGMLVPVGDPASLAAAMLRFVHDPDLRAQMGAASRAKALEEFDDRRQIDVTLRTYDRLLWQRGARRQ